MGGRGRRRRGREEEDEKEEDGRRMGEGRRRREEEGGREKRIKSSKSVYHGYFHENPFLKKVNFCSKVKLLITSSVFNENHLTAIYNTGKIRQLDRSELSK